MLTAGQAVVAVVGRRASWWIRGKLGRMPGTLEPSGRIRILRVVGGREGGPFVRSMFGGKPQGDGYKHFKRGEEGESGNNGGFRSTAWIGLVPASFFVYYVVHLDQAPYTGRCGETTLMAVDH
eukprot:273508-Hanusia_phi.AAC.1